MIRNTPNFTYEQGLACPMCGSMLQKRYSQDRHGRYKRIFPKITRPEKDGPWAKDDVLENKTEQVGKYESRVVGRVWVHTASLVCNKCGSVMSPGNGIPHEFTDEELPFDFWEKPWGEYLPEEKPVPEEPAYKMRDPYGMDELF